MAAQQTFVGRRSILFLQKESGQPDRGTLQRESLLLEHTPLEASETSTPLQGAPCWSTKRITMAAVVGNASTAGAGTASGGRKSTMGAAERA